MNSLFDFADFHSTSGLTMLTCFVWGSDKNHLPEAHAWSWTRYQHISQYNTIYQPLRKHTLQWIHIIRIHISGLVQWSCNNDSVDCPFHVQLHIPVDLLGHTSKASTINPRKYPRPRPSRCWRSDVFLGRIFMYTSHHAYLKHQKSNKSI